MNAGRHSFMKLWTLDKIYGTESGKLYYIRRRKYPSQREGVKLYFSCFSTPQRFPTLPPVAHDKNIAVTVGATEGEVMRLATSAGNCAVYSYRTNQHHFLPLWWFPAANVWGYYSNAFLGLWVKGKQHSAEDLCKLCPHRIRRALDQCLPLAPSCELPYSVYGVSDKYANFCWDNWSKFTNWSVENYVPSSCLKSRNPRVGRATVDDLD